MFSPASNSKFPGSIYKSHYFDKYINKQAWLVFIDQTILCKFGIHNLEFLWYTKYNSSILKRYTPAIELTELPNKVGKHSIFGL